jgi:hypothetical protein
VLKSEPEHPVRVARMKKAVSDTSNVFFCINSPKMVRGHRHPVSLTFNSNPRIVKAPGICQ